MRLTWQGKVQTLPERRLRRSANRWPDHDTDDRPVNWRRCLLPVGPMPKPLVLRPLPDHLPMTGKLGSHLPSPSCNPKEKGAAASNPSRRSRYRSRRHPFSRQRHLPSAFSDRYRAGQHALSDGSRQRNLVRPIPVALVNRLGYHSLQRPVLGAAFRWRRE